MTKIVFPVALLLLMTSCTSMTKSSLTVDVSLYAGPTPISAIEARKEINAVLTQPIFNDAGRRDLFNNILQSYQKQVIAEIEANLPASLNAAQKRQASGTIWLDDKGLGLGPIIEDALNSLAKSAESIARDALKFPLIGNRRALDQNSARALQALKNQRVIFDTKLKATLSQIDNALRTHLPEDSIQKLNAQAYRQLSGAGDMARSIASDDLISGRAVGYPVFDPVVSAVIRPDDIAPGRDNDLSNRSGKGPRHRRESERETSANGETHWVPFVSNEFEARGGNSQFVVVREGLVVFHPKSLDFDPTPVIGAGAAVTRLGLKVAAAMASGASGLQLPLAETSAKTGNQTSSQRYFNEAEMQSQAALLEQRQQSKLQILEVLANIYQRLKVLQSNGGGSPAELDGIKRDIKRQAGLYSALVTTQTSEAQ